MRVFSVLHLRHRFYFNKHIGMVGTERGTKQFEISILYSQGVVGDICRKSCLVRELVG